MEQRVAYLAEYQQPYSLLYTYSLIIALVCGTAGLPHILVRFYTDPHAASGGQGIDKVVLELTRILNEGGGVLGSVLSGITWAGAFDAFMSAFSGLLVAMTAAFGQDVYGRMLRPRATAEQRMRMFK